MRFTLGQMLCMGVAVCSMVTVVAIYYRFSSGMMAVYYGFRLGTVAINDGFSSGRD